MPVKPKIASFGRRLFDCVCRGRFPSEGKDETGVQKNHIDFEGVRGERRLAKKATQISESECRADRV